jgi:hypothetical protein
MRDVSKREAGLTIITIIAILVGALYLVSFFKG